MEQRTVHQLIRSRRRKALQRINSARERYDSDLYEWEQKLPEGKVRHVRSVFDSGPYAGQKCIEVMLSLGHAYPKLEDPSESDARVYKFYYGDGS